jgi:TPR repeat protein
LNQLFPFTTSHAPALVATAGDRAANVSSNSSPRRSGNLGVMYESGLGVPQDYAQAHMWFNLAASHASNASDRDMAAQSRDALAAKMTPSQIAEAQRMAREWVPK